MNQAEAMYRTLRAVEDYLTEQFEGCSVRRETPKTITAETFIVSGKETAVVGIEDGLLSAITINGGYLDKEKVADLFQSGDVLSKMRAARGGTVVVVSINGDAITP